ncbi:OmpW/AlkL family protein [Zavarzinia compransoris]|uniref:OmpW family protein n=1 Tax=Zavarzinia compransoris TaxID=1264899 RepID=A0A317E7U4_9PROT|nr:OmpW family protein [Zavarzinia compransoris]PWR23137.1 OmpW family protein [Zavarzinia compransoris]TDP46308.1 outer membrane protein [Zavarzinia compransoris]
MKRTTGLALAALVLAAGTARPAKAEGESPWQVRGRALFVLPEESGALSTGGTRIPGDVSIDTSVIPELDITYFFTPNVAVELILGTTRHNAKAVNTPLGTADLGDVWLLPPTLTLQYHFAPDGKIRPYIGAGVNYTIFYGKDEPSGLSVDYKNNFGWALQAGVDIPIDDHWSLNVDVKKVFLSTDVKVRGLAVPVDADVDIDPTLVGVGVGYRF